MVPIPRTSAIGSRVAPKRTVKRPAAAKAAAAAEEEEAEEEEKAEVAKAGLAKERQRSKGLTGSGGRVAEAAGKKRMPKAIVGSSGADAETARKKPRHTAPADCAGQKEDKSSAPTALDGLTDSGGSCTTKAADVRDPSVLDARTILLDGEQTAEEYLRLMSQPHPSPESWGGESELHAMARLWGCRICILLLREDPAEGSQVRLLTGPLGTVGHIHTLLFNGSHYDLVILTKEQLIMLGLLPCA